MSRVAYTIKAAASAASVDKATIVRAIQSGHLRARRVDDCLVILRCDLKTWTESLPDYLLIG